MNILAVIANIRLNIQKHYHREYIVSLLCCAVIFLFADQNLMSPNLSIIAEEFHFSDTQRDDLLGGKIALGFFVIGGIVSVAAGFLADTVNRIRIFSYIVILGELSCVLTYWSTTYTQLFICRIFTGISIGGASPIIFSLLADFYPGGSRIKMSTLIGISMGIGTSSGQVLAGFLGPVYGWRLPFLLVGAPAIFFAIWILFTGQEPRRGGQEEGVRSIKKSDDYCFIDIHSSSNNNNNNSSSCSSNGSNSSINHSNNINYSNHSSNNNHNNSNNNSTHNPMMKTRTNGIKNSHNSNNNNNSNSSTSRPLASSNDSYNQKQRVLDDDDDDDDENDTLPSTVAITTAPTAVVAAVPALATQSSSSSSSSLIVNKPKNVISYIRLTDDDDDDDDDDEYKRNGHKTITTSSSHGHHKNKNDDNDDDNGSSTISVSISDKSDTSLIRVVRHSNTNTYSNTNSNSNSNNSNCSSNNNKYSNTSSSSISSGGSSSSNSNNSHPLHHDNRHDSDIMYKNRRSNNHNHHTYNNNNNDDDDDDDDIHHHTTAHNLSSHNHHHHNHHHHHTPPTPHSGYDDNNKNHHHTISSTVTKGMVLKHDEIESPPPPSHHHHHQEDSDHPHHQEEIHYSEKIEFQKVLGLFRNKSVLLIFAQGIPGCAPWGMIGTFLNDYFSNDRHMSVMHATFALTMFGIGTLIGQLLGGFFGQYLYNRDKRLQCLLMGVSSCLGVFPMLYLVNSPQTGTVLFYFMAVTGGLVVAVTGPNVRAVLQNVCTPETRGTAFSLYNLTDDIGKGVGPAIVVELIRLNGHDRQTAFTIVTWFWMLCGVLLLGLTFTVLDDEQRVQEHVRTAIIRQSTKTNNNHTANNMNPTIAIATTTTKVLTEQRNPLISSSSSSSSSSIIMRQNQEKLKGKKIKKDYTSLLTQDCEVCV